MGIFSVVLIAMSLSMDAFAVSVSNGIAVKRFSTTDGARMGLYFGFFQFIMPLIGWALGSSVRFYIEKIDHWVAFILLSVVGINMIKESFADNNKEEFSFFLTSKTLIFQGIATSVDALAVGISFAVLDVNILISAIIIGAICFTISFLGGVLGKTVGELFKGKAEALGGTVLILMGLRIILQNFDII